MTYGLGTRSYNRSTEARQNKLARKKFNEKYERGEVVFTSVEIRVCACRSFRFAHDPERHKELPGGDLDWRTPEERANQHVYEERIR